MSEYTENIKLFKEAALTREQIIVDIHAKAYNKKQVEKKHLPNN